MILHKYKTLFFALLFISFIKIYADNEGTTAAQFLKISLNPRIEGMGGAGAASYIDEVFYNPASVAKIDTVKTRTGYVSWFEDMNKANVFCAVPVEKINIKVGGNLSYFKIGDLKSYDSSGNETGDYKRNSSEISVFAARNIGRLSLGVVLKSVFEKYDSESGSALGGDVGLIFQLSRSIALGGAIQNLGSKLKIAGVEKELPGNKKAGIQFKPAEILSMNFDIDMPDDSENRQHLGAEVEFAKNYFLRSGWQKFGDIKGVTFGFGLKFPSSSWSKPVYTRREEKMISVDYSYQTNSEFSSIHRFSIGVDF
ncbi:MAG: PorV/PorQ family protein [Planctomycetota bacterium]